MTGERDEQPTGRECPYCGCHFRRLSDERGHDCAAGQRMREAANRQLGVLVNSGRYEEALQRICADAEEAPMGDVLGAGRIAREALRGPVVQSDLPADHPVVLAQRLYTALNTEDVARARALLARLVDRLGSPSALSAERALLYITEVLGPGPHDCPVADCEGCKWEMAEAFETAKEALKRVK